MPAHPPPTDSAASATLVNATMQKAALFLPIRRGWGIGMPRKLGQNLATLDSISLADVYLGLTNLEMR